MTVNGYSADLFAHLAAACALLDACARRQVFGGCSIDGLVQVAVDDFLAVYHKRSTVALPEEVKRDALVIHRGRPGESFHEVTCRIAHDQFSAICPYVVPELFHDGVIRKWGFTVDQIVAEWPNIANELVERFSEPIDAEYLIAGIETDGVCRDTRSTD